MPCNELKGNLDYEKDRCSQNTGRQIDFRVKPALWNLQRVIRREAIATSLAMASFIFHNPSLVSQEKQSKSGETT